MSVLAAAVLLLGTATAGRAGEVVYSSGEPASCCEPCGPAPSRGVLSRLKCRERCAEPCGAPTCSGPRGVMNRRHRADCCAADDCGQSHIQKFMAWLCYRPSKCCRSKAHAPCCTPPLYTFFTCCENDGCYSRDCSTCGSCCDK